MQCAHYGSEPADVLATSTQGELRHKPVTANGSLASFPLTNGDFYGSGHGTGFQYYCNYSWPQNLTSGNGASQDQVNKNVLLQYGQGGHFYPMYPSVITAAFGGDVSSAEGGQGGSGVAMDPRYQHSCILELRKEKSRDAARSRRGKENYEFYELAKMLPLPGAITSQLDKASIIRLTISFLKLRDFSSHGDPPWQRDGSGSGKNAKAAPTRRRSMPSLTCQTTDIFETHQGTHILQSLDGFVFALSNDGRFLYISETVSIYLGLSQVEMTGSSLFDYTHVQDHQELAEQLGLNSQGIYSTCNNTSSAASDDGNNSNTSRAVTPTLPERTSVMNPNPSKGYDRCFCIRMKSTLTKRGVHVKSSGYRVVQILAHMRPQFSFSMARKHPAPLLGLVAMAIALPPPTLTELIIDNDMFITRLSPELKVTYCEPRISDMMDICADDFTNKNMYDYCHAEDLQKLRKAHIDLLGKGQVLTDYFRLMNKHGGYVWVQTCATIICNAKNADEQNIIAINYVLSGIEYGGCVMNTNQLKVVSKTEPDQSDHSENEQGSDQEDKPHKHDHLMASHDKPNGDNRRGCHGNKRKHATQNDFHTDVASRDADSPVNSFDLLYQKHKNLAKETQAVANGLIGMDGHKSIGYLDKNKMSSHDLKNSRRKMDKPRKRKRDQLERAGKGGAGLTTGGVDGTELELGSTVNTADLGTCSIGADGSCLLPSCGLGGSRPASTHSSVTAPSPILPTDETFLPQPPRLQSSPAPEDLSVRTSQSPLMSSSPGHQRPLSPGLPPACSVTSTVSVTTNSQRASWVDTSVVSTTEPMTDIPITTGSSVRDLEEAMNKHLPSVPGEADHIRASLAAAADYNQSMLGLHQKHKSTIQWIGSQNQGAATTDTLPATNLLRSLYVNRESVIRPNIYNPRPQYYGSADMQNTLLTPPGAATDPYKENFVSTNLSQSKSSPSNTSYPGLISSYSTSPISVSMANANMTDAYAMTPPSSVSPQEKYPMPFSEHQFHTDMSMPSLRGYPPSSHDSTLAIPIKPQAYPLPAHANNHVSSYDRPAQYSTPPSYYGASFTPYNPTASPTPAHYRDARAANVW